MTTKKKKAPAGKPAIESYDQGIEALREVKEAIAAGREEMTEFLKTNKLKRNKDYSADKTHGKAFKAIRNKIDELVVKKDELTAKLKALKPKKERSLKYEYPADVLGDKAAMRKYRAKMRTKAAKAEGSEGEEKPKKKVAKTTTSTTKTAPAAKKKVVRKKKAAEPDED